MRELVSSANVYYTDRGTIANTRLLHNIAHYLTFLLRVFGVVPSDGGLGFPIEQDGTTDQVSSSWRQEGEAKGGSHVTCSPAGGSDNTLSHSIGRLQRTS